MPERESSSLLSRFQSFQASARRIEPTGDAALDLLLSTSGEHFAGLVVKNCVPHWFTAESIALLGAGPRDFEDLLALPFVRLHPLGHTYHDEVRRVLRAWSIASERGLYLETCSALYRTADRWMPAEGNDETEAERLYLWLAADPAAAFPAVEERIAAARDAKRLNFFDTLVHVLEEQSPVLDSVLQQKVEYYRGLLLYDQRAYSDALEILVKLPFTSFDAPFAAAARFRVGLSLERCGSWRDAERFYRRLLRDVAKGSPGLQFRAKILHRLAQVALALRDLGSAEKYARASLRLDTEGRTRYGQAVNLRLLGVIHEKLRDRKRAHFNLAKALEIFRELDIPGEVARSLNDLGNMLISFGEFLEADRTLIEAAAMLAALGDSYGLAFVYANLGKAAVGRRTGMDEALRDYNAALSLFQQFRDRINAAKVLRNMAIAYEFQKRMDEAVESMTKALAELPEDNALRNPWMRESIRLRKG